MLWIYFVFLILSSLALSVSATTTEKTSFYFPSELYPLVAEHADTETLRALRRASTLAKQACKWTFPKTNLEESEFVTASVDCNLDNYGTVWTLRSAFRKLVAHGKNFKLTKKWFQHVQKLAEWISQAECLLFEELGVASIEETLHVAYGHLPDAFQISERATLNMDHHHLFRSSTPRYVKPLVGRSLQKRAGYILSEAKRNANQPEFKKRLLEDQGFMDAYVQMIFHCLFGNVPLEERLLKLSLMAQFLSQRSLQSRSAGTPLLHDVSKRLFVGFGVDLAGSYMLGSSYPQPKEPALYRSADGSVQEYLWMNIEGDLFVIPFQAFQPFSAESAHMVQDEPRPFPELRRLLNIHSNFDLITAESLFQRVHKPFWHFKFMVDFRHSSEVQDVHSFLAYCRSAFIFAFSISILHLTLNDFSSGKVLDLVLLWTAILVLFHVLYIQGRVHVIWLDMLANRIHLPQQ